MKKYLIILLALSMQLGFAQKISKKDLLDNQKKIYNMALKNYDLDAAKTSIYQILAIEGEQSSYLDSLGYLYFTQQNYVSFIAVADKILKKGDNPALLERKAIALENLGDFKAAISAYEKVFAQKKTPLIAYKLGKLQQQLKRSAEAYATLNAVKDAKFPEKAYITMPSGKKGKTQNVLFKAAYLNLLGMISYDLHSYDMSVKYFEDALKLQPDFFVAKQNKNAIEILAKKLKATPKK